MPLQPSFGRTVGSDGSTITAKAVESVSPSGLAFFLCLHAPAPVSVKRGR